MQFNSVYHVAHTLLGDPGARLGGFERKVLEILLILGHKSGGRIIRGTLFLLGSRSFLAFTGIVQQ